MKIVHFLLRSVKASYPAIYGLGWASTCRAVMDEFLQFHHELLPNRMDQP